jgi:hypothetical protein
MSMRRDVSVRHNVLCMCNRRQLGLASAITEMNRLAAW